MENAIKNSSKLIFCEVAAGAASRRLNGLLHNRLPAFLAASYDVIISIGGHTVNDGVENRKRRKAY